MYNVPPYRTTSFTLYRVLIAQMSFQVNPSANKSHLLFLNITPVTTPVDSVVITAGPPFVADRVKVVDPFVAIT